MKTFFTLTAIVAASLVATSSKAQVYPVPAPVYQDEYAPGPAVVVGANFDYEFPGYAYYNYPAWNGHYRDYYYYAHYRPFFERTYAGYFNGRRFDGARFGARFGNPGYARGYVNRGPVNRGFAT